MGFKYELGIIGAGNMAQAIVKGILSSKLLNENQIIMSATSERKIGRVDVVIDNNYVVNKSKYILIAVKPQIFDNIAESIKGLNNELIISIMAGKGSKDIIKALDAKNSEVIRVMPNTPCMIGQGMTCITDNSQNVDHKNFVSGIFSSIGEIAYVDESLFDAITCVSGSGPAYVYYFIKSMMEGGIKAGLDKETALKLTLQTFNGAINMVKTSADDISVLIQKVCSKGGTTIQAINNFENEKLNDIIIDSMMKCKKRSEDLSK